MAEKEHFSKWSRRFCLPFLFFFRPEQIEKLLTLQRQVYDLRLKRDSTLVQNETLKQNIDALKESVEDYKKIVEEKVRLAPVTSSFLSVVCLICYLIFVF